MHALARARIPSLKVCVAMQRLDSLLVDAFPINEQLPIVQDVVSISDATWSLAC